MAFSLSEAGRAVFEQLPQQTSDGWRERAGMRAAIAAVVTLLRRQARGEVRAAAVDEALLHVLVSIDAPRADRTTLRLRVRGEERPFRDVVQLLARWPKHIGGAIARIDETLHWFDVDAKAAHEHVVARYSLGYSGFMPSAETVHRTFFTATPAEQQDFLRSFLQTYDEGTDITSMPGADEAAAWLRAHRRCRADKTLVLRDDVDTIDGAVDAVDIHALDVELRAALADYAAIVHDVQAQLIPLFKTSTTYARAPRVFDQRPPQQWPTDMGMIIAVLQPILDGAVSAHGAGLIEVLTALQVPPPQISMAVLAAACVPLVDEDLPPWPLQPITEAAGPTFQAARARLHRATTAVLERGC